MKHCDLVQRAARWLTNTMRCQPVFTEQNIWAITESPDAIGWTSRGSILVECKVSRVDFARDRHKDFRHDPDRGVGKQRYYMTPPGLLNESDLPERWGLLECREKIVKVVVHPSSFDEYYRDGEIQLLRAAHLNGRPDHSLRYEPKEAPDDDDKSSD